ncbi:hypothetical protein H4R99_005027 [Coemansia sp. RSA 1722]|nr:hypothetical protein H4R99_005027 [Coemansia sp. RSA 1722]
MARSQEAHNDRTQEQPDWDTELNDLFSDLRNTFDVALMPTMFSGRVVPLYQDPLWEPPYARLLRRLGLFDPLILPPRPAADVAYRTDRSTFPVVAYSARHPSQPQQTEIQPSSRSGADAADSAGHGRLIGTIGEVFGDTTRWAVGNLFGQLREAMDHIESSVSRNDPARHDGQRNTQSLFRALRSDLIANFDRLFPEPTEGEKSDCRYYHISTYTMPDGAIETRKVVRNNDGTETTTITRRDPESPGSDQVIQTTTTPSERAASASAEQEKS